MLVSVIVPIYKVERFIGLCAESLMAQTLMRGIEYIFVDDCSPDDSLAILRAVLAKYPERQPCVKIVTHEENKGLPSARNTGLKYATGKYVYHCDSDDRLAPEALDLLVSTAESKDADIVWCDWYLSFDKNERYMKQPEYATADEALRGILHGRMKYNVWNKLVRRALYEEHAIRFPDGHGMGEDMTMIRLFACASRVAYLPKALYHYSRTNGEAFTHTWSNRNLCDIRYNLEETIAFLKEKKGDRFCDDVSCFKLSVKYPFLISDKREMYMLWQEWYPEANVYIWKNREIGLRGRILQYAAWKGCFGLVWIHYQLVYRLVYGLIYR